LKTRPLTKNSFGTFTKFEDLTSDEQELVKLARSAAASSERNQLCFLSNFPVGAAILARNEKGEILKFGGCNVESKFFTSICAERNAATTLAYQGYKHFLCIALVCRVFPCGLCRQFLRQFGPDAILLNIVDRENRARRTTVGALLPAATNGPVPYSQLDPIEQRLVRSAIRLKSRSYVPYSKHRRAALFIATNNRNKQRVFEGVSDEIASCGGSAMAETVAMRTARTASYDRDVKLIVTVDEPNGINQIDGESLQVLREFGPDAPILLVGTDKSVVTSTLDELLPNSFGPENYSFRTRDRPLPV
jgi:cytidine deaminase